MIICTRIISRKQFEMYFYECPPYILHNWDVCVYLSSQECGVSTKGCRSMCIHEYYIMYICVVLECRLNYSRKLVLSVHIIKLRVWQSQDLFHSVDVGMRVTSPLCVASHQTRSRGLEEPAPEDSPRAPGDCLPCHGARIRRDPTSRPWRWVFGKDGAGGYRRGLREAWKDGRGGRRVVKKNGHKWDV